MTIIRSFFLMALLAAPLATPVWADGSLAQAMFTTVSGDVRVKSGEKVRVAKLEMVVSEGDKIRTMENSSAVLKLFDGSELTISANTQFTLTALHKTEEEEGKNIKFKMLWGTLSALVTRLTTAHSSFEIETGGVVCGVRGTQFSMTCSGVENPKVEVEVKHGSVYTNDSFGNHFIINGGSHMGFLNGAALGGPANSNNSSNYKKTTNNTTTGSGTGSSSNSNSNGNTGSSTSNAQGNNGDNSSTNGASANETNGSSTGATGSGGNTGSASNGTNGSNVDNGGASGTGSTNSGSGAPPVGGSTGSGNTGLETNGLTDLNHQFQNNVLINGDQTLTNPTVQQAIQLSINPVIGH